MKQSYLAFLIVLCASGAQAQSSCNEIKNDVKAKIACLDERVAQQRNKPRSGTPDPVDLLRDENEQLQRRLKGICKGC